MGGGNIMGEAGRLGRKSDFMLGVEGEGENMPGVEGLVVGGFNGERGDLVL